MFLGCVPGERSSPPTHSDGSGPTGRVERLHQNARQHAEKVNDGVELPEVVTSKDADGIGTTNYATGWDVMVADYSIQYDDCPYGSLYVGGEVYEKEGTSYYGYGVNHVHRANPGSNYCGSDWSINDSHLRLKWDAFYRAEPMLHQNYPDSGRTGNFSVNGSIGYSGASLGVSYNPPDIRRNVNAGWAGTENVEWKWDYVWDPDSPVQHQPASIIKSPEKAIGGIWGGDRLLGIEAGGTFIHLWEGNHDTTFSPYIYVD